MVSSARAGAGECITITLTDEVDVSRGDVIAAADAAPTVAERFEARLLSMGTDDLVPGHSYFLKTHSKRMPAVVTAIHHRIDVDTGSHLATQTLALNEIGRVSLTTAHPIAFEPFQINRTLGAFTSMIVTRSTRLVPACSRLACLALRVRTRPLMSWGQLGSAEAATATLLVVYGALWRRQVSDSKSP